MNSPTCFLLVVFLRVLGPDPCEAGGYQQNTYRRETQLRSTEHNLNKHLLPSSTRNQISHHHVDRHFHYVHGILQGRGMYYTTYFIWGFELTRWSQPMGRLQDFASSDRINNVFLSEISTDASSLTRVLLLLQRYCMNSLICSVVHQGDAYHLR